jgi:uncharacterized hydrophobic protein (TIGR00271 family)
VITVRVCCPANLSSDVAALLAANPAASTLAVHTGALISPPGDIIEADLPREAVNDVIDALAALGVPAQGTIQILPVSTWVSQRALDTEERVTGSRSNAVVWADVVERAYEGTALTWTFLAFMTMATLLAGIAIATDSVILIIGAMVLGPEFVAIAALGVGLVRRRWHLLGRALLTLLVGFTLSIAIVTVFALVARSLDLVQYSQLLTENRPGTNFIFTANWWSFAIALIAGSAGVLALTSSRSESLVGVFISVTTIPAAGNIALALAYGMWPEMWGSILTLFVNIGGMAVAGWVTLAVQQHGGRHLRRWRARREPRRPVPR